MSKNIDQVFNANPITSNTATDLMYFGQSPYGAGNDAAMTYANFAVQFGSPYTASALTSSNDTNVTITLGGSPTTALLHATSLTMGWAGQLSLTRGGSNASLTASNGGIVYSTASAFAILAGTATANLPLLSGLSTTPSWGAFALSLGGALTTAGSLTTVGAFGATFNFTNTTNVTFPTSGTLATTSGSLPSIQGTANQVLVNGTSGSPVSGTAITLTTPQNIGTTSTPQFSGAYFGSATGPVASASGTVQTVGLSGGLGNYIASSYFNGSGSAPTYFCYKSRSASVGSFTAVQSGDVLGRFLVFGDDGTQFSEAAAIVLQATGTISNGIVPGFWSFQTANASGSLTTAMTIDSSQVVALTNALASSSGGTGVNNGSSTITIGGSVTFSGAFGFTGTLTNTTSVTFPTSGTLATTSQIPSFPLSLANGGTNASLVASNGGIFYSTASAAAILGGTATANQVLLSGSSTTPAWSTAAYPATTTVNQILWSSSDNVIAGLATGNNGVLITSAGGVPSISSTLPSAVQGNITTVGTIGTGTWQGSVIGGTYGGTGVNNGASTITIGGSVTFSGAFTFTGTVTGNTSVTFPTSGTLATTSQVISAVDQTSSSVTLAPNTLYVIDNGASLVTLTFPATSAIGDTYKIIGKSAGGWRVAQLSGQTIHYGSSSTTTGVAGSLSSSNQYDCIEITCNTTNTTFTAYSGQGNLTVV